MAQSPKAKRAYVVREDVEWKKLGQSSLLLLPYRNEFYKLNHTATRSFELLKAGATIEEIGAVLSKEYDVVKNVASSDIAALVKEMEQKGVITPTP